MNAASAAGNRPSAAALLEVRGLSAGYGNLELIHDVSFSLPRGAFASLLGPSGAGKTTLMLTLAGFTTIRSGRLIFEGTTIASPRRMVPPERRRIGMVFQDHALFPNLTVADNVLAGRSSRDPGRRREVVELLENLGLAELAGRYPDQLSGGQRQRVALARAVAAEPGLLLLDEPFANLDRQLHEQVGFWIRDVLRRLDISCIVITHEPEDALAFSDLVGVMDDGRLLQWSDTQTLRTRPNCLAVARMTYGGNLVPVVTGTNECFHGQLGALAVCDPELPPGAAAFAMVDWDNLLAVADPDGQGRIGNTFSLGQNDYVEIVFHGGVALTARVADAASFVVDEPATVKAGPRPVRLITD